MLPERAARPQPNPLPLAGEGALCGTAARAGAPDSHAGTREGRSFEGAEAALVARWLARPAAGLRLEDGRPLKVIFPGVPGPGHGPDVRDAILDAGGDYLKGDVEFHLAASGWRAHGHQRDPAYGRVVLHVAAVNDGGEAWTLHGDGRRIPLLVFRPGTPVGFPPPFTPPCAFAAAAGRDLETPLEALSRRRLRMKAARLEPLVQAAGEGQALYAALLETCGGPANREAFGALAGRLPLAAALEEADAAPDGVARPLAIAAAFKGAANGIAMERRGLRPAAQPARRVETAAAVVAGLWPRGAAPEWPGALEPGARLPRAVQAAGAGRSLAIELCVNAVLPLALASGRWQEADVLRVWEALPSPGVYGVLRPLEGWLSAAGERPFRGAARLQAGLLLHRDYCSRGACGRCPLSD